MGSAGPSAPIEEISGGFPSALRLRRALILRREIRAAVAAAAHEPVDAQPALAVASFRAGWRDELEASDWFFVIAELDPAAYSRGQAAGRRFRAAVQAQGKRRADWSGFSSLA